MVPGMLVPTYGLYGEDPANSRPFWLHCETIMSRSSAYRFEIGLHRHESFLQFLYIKSGAGDVVLQDAVIALAPPCVVVIPPAHVHGFRFSRDIDGVVITLATQVLREPLRLVINEALAQFTRPLMIGIESSSSDATYLNQTFGRIIAENQMEMPQRDVLLEIYLAAVTLIVVRYARPDYQVHTLSQAERRVLQYKELVAKHVRQHLSTEEYAQRLGVSPTHLNRLVRSVTGRTAHDLIIDRLMDEACRELVFTAYSIQQISDNLGFSDAAYFSRVFRQRMKMTPKTFRSQEIDRLRNKAG